MIHACHAGCDFSRHWLDLSSLSPLAIPVAAPVAAGRFANDAAGRQALLRRLTEAGPNQSGPNQSGPDQSGPDQSGVALLVIEASGGTEQGLLIAAWAAGQKVALVPAQRVRHFARSLEQQARTDRIDAHVLALYAARTGPASTPATGENHRRLRTLVARRRILVGMRADERKRGLHCGTDSVARSITALDTCLSAEIKTIEAAIRAAIQTCRDSAARAARRLGMPGIGPATAATLLAELPELGQVSQGQVSQGQVSQGQVSQGQVSQGHVSQGQVTSGQIAALAGLATFTRQSGQWRSKSWISGGRKPVRDALYMAATTCVFRTQSRFATFYKSLRARGKPHKRALIATMRKMLTTLNAMLRNDQNFTPA